MNGDFLKAYLKDAFAKSLKDGGSQAGVTFMEELAEALTTDQLGKLIKILNRVYEKKKNVVEQRR
jgi:hypothetical protein